jgi:phosphatidylserine/phosphatidylglycerophosphate/cardiolipin synthase-like enzyme
MKYPACFRCLGLALVVAWPVSAYAACPPSRIDAIGAYFASTHDDAGLSLALIEQARERVLVAGYPALPPALARALADARRRGVDVHVVLDRSRAPWRYSGATALALAGVDVAALRARMPAAGRFVVADDAVALGAAGYRATEDGHETGGFNLFRHAPELARAYAGEFWRLRGESVRH